MAVPATRLVESVSRLQELADLVIPFAIRVVCDLGLADELVAGPRPVADLAAATGTHAPTLRRLLRALASKEIFTEVETDRFGLTPLAELLTSRHPLSVRGAYPLLSANFDAWSRLEHTVRTGRPAFDHVFGMGYYDHLAVTPYDCERFVANQQAGDRLEIVELPHMAARAAEHLERAGVAGRCEVVAGSFLETMPAGAGGYVLKRVLFECDDERARALLGGIRRALPETGRVLVLDPLVEPGNEFSPSKVYDLLSLVMTGGRARYREEIEALLRDAGLQLTRVVPTQMFPIVEARPL